MKNRFQLNDRITHIGAMFALTLGVLKVIGILSGVWIFTYIGNTFAIAPAPGPFSELPHYSMLDTTIGDLFGCEEAGGNVTWHRWNHLVRGAIPGPHRRNVTFLNFYAHLETFMNDVNGTNANHSVIEKVLKYNYCHGGPIASAAGCPQNMSAVLLKSVDPLTKSTYAFRRIPCSP